MVSKVPDYPVTPLTVERKSELRALVKASLLRLSDGSVSRYAKLYHTPTNSVYRIFHQKESTESTHLSSDFRTALKTRSFEQIKVYVDGTFPRDQLANFTDDEPYDEDESEGDHSDENYVEEALEVNARVRTLRARNRRQSVKAVPSVRSTQIKRAKSAHAALGIRSHEAVNITGLTPVDALLQRLLKKVNLMHFHRIFFDATLYTDNHLQRWNRLPTEQKNSVLETLRQLSKGVSAGVPITLLEGQELLAELAAECDGTF